jgi:DNA-binding NtrC family response regulator
MMRRLAILQNENWADTKTEPEDSFVNLSDRVTFDGRLNYLKTLAAIMANELEALHRFDNNGRRPTLKNEVSRFETELIRNALAIARGSQRRAARLLGLSPTTLHTKIRRLKINLEESCESNFQAVNALPGAATIESGSSLVESMSNFEIQLIENALDQAGGNQTKAARLLGIPLTTLNFKVQKYKINSSTFAMRNPFRMLRMDHKTSAETFG